ncbi:MAG: dehydrogenase [Candidatus Cloacimonadota bacterium]|nr:MAG: dehydrogenase [Candidatus Cloacimonadota bacterium]
MINIQDELRAKAKELLKKKKVNVLIGYGSLNENDLPKPIFIREEKDVDMLVWNPFCINNLGKYLLKERGKIGIVAKGCDVRSIIGLIQEHKIKRENIVILGIRCPGIIDIRKLPDKGNATRLHMERKNNVVMVGGKKMQFEEVCYDKCLTCKYPSPIEADFRFGEEVKARKENEGDSVSKLESMNIEERLKYWDARFEKCIRCTACREICPFCYCERCILDETIPAWVSRSTDLSDTRLFHMIRFLHVAGRCVDCGECERACPMELPLRKIVKMIEKDIKEMFDFEPGTSLEDIPVLAQYNIEDREDFIR